MNPTIDLIIFSRIGAYYDVNSNCVSKMAILYFIHKIKYFYLLFPVFVFVEQFRQEVRDSNEFDITFCLYCFILIKKTVINNDVFNSSGKKDGREKICISRNILTCLSRNILTCIPRNILTCLSRNILTCISRNILTCIPRNILTCLSRNILTCISRNILTCISRNI